MVDELLAGHGRFRADLGPTEREFLAGLATDGQRPVAVFIGCSDSRVIPEQLTDSGPGRLFVVRNVANHIPRPSDGERSVNAAIEFAVDQLGVTDIIVCGHDGCGGVQAALDGLAGLKPDSDLGSWLADVRPAVAGARASDLDPVARLARAVEENVLAGLATLGQRWHAPDVASSIRLHGWVYDLGQAALRVYDAGLARFIPVAELPSDELRAAWFRTRILVRMGGRTIEIDRVPAGSLASSLAPIQLPLTIVTAWNPFGMARARNENRAANRRLFRELTDAGHQPAVAIGRAADGTWAEPGFAIGALGEADALALARRWDQLGVFVATEEEVIVLTSADGAFVSRPRGQRYEAGS
jgi:carbonic anhydrase